MIIIMMMMMMIPIVVTLSGIEIDVSDEHLLKAEAPINCIGLERCNVIVVLYRL